MLKWVRSIVKKIIALCSLPCFHLSQSSLPYYTDREATLNLFFVFEKLFVRLMYESGSALCYIVNKILSFILFNKHYLIT